MTISANSKGILHEEQNTSYKESNEEQKRYQDGQERRRGQLNDFQTKKSLYFGQIVINKNNYKKIALFYHLI